MTLTPPRRSLTDYILPIFIIIAIGIVAVLAIRLWIQMSGGNDPLALSSPSEASLTVRAGTVEAYLPASEAWKIVSAPGTQLASGERVRTSADGVAYLTLEDGTRVTLAPESEVALDELSTTLRSKTATLALVRGQAWVDATDARGGALTVGTKLLRVEGADGAFLITRASEKAEDAALSVVSGGANAAVLDPQKNSTKPIKAVAVEKGQTVEITERRVNLLRIGGDLELVKDTPAAIASTPFYIANASTIATTAADTTLPTTTTPTTTPTTTTTDTTADVGMPVVTTPTTPATTADVTPTTTTTTARLDAPVVSSPKSGSTISTDPVEIRGVASAATAKIEVTVRGSTPYILQSYKAGSGSWLYRASTKLGNLAVGANSYTIVAIDDDGNRSNPTTLTFTYQTADTVTTPTTSSTTPTTTTTTPATTTPVVTTPTTSASGTFGAPTVTSPANGTTFTSAPVRLSGTVPAGTASVSVNGYALTKFVAGSTSWYYTADPKYANLKAGTNEYEIVATSTTGEKGSTTVTITYTPVETPATTPAE